MSYIHIEVDDHEVTEELDRLIKGPSFTVISEFEALLIEVTGRVMMDIHVETGSLKSTVRPSSHMDSSFEWQGTVHVGGAAPGAVNDPAYYGVFELARGHEGGRNHHFYEVAHEKMPDGMIDTILKWMADGRWHR